MLLAGTGPAGFDDRRAPRPHWNAQNQRQTRKRQISPIRSGEFYAWILRLEKLGGVGADGCDLAFLSIPCFEIVRGIVASIARDPDIENCVIGANMHRSQEAFEHLPPLIHCDIYRERSGLRQIILRAVHVRGAFVVMNIVKLTRLIRVWTTRPM